MILPAFVEHIDAGLRSGQPHIGLPCQDGGHHLVGPAAVGELHVQTLLFEEAQLERGVHRRVKDRVGDLVEPHFCAGFPSAAGGKQAYRQNQTQNQCDAFFHTVTPIYFFMAFSSHRIHWYISAAAAARISTVVMTRSILNTCEPYTMR